MSNRIFVKAVALVSAFMAALFMLPGLYASVPDSSAPVQQEDPVHINGIVRDVMQNPLVGVAVIVKGTDTGTLTDENGQYFIDVPDRNAVLEFSCLGLEKSEVTVGSQININVNLKEKSDIFNEVVVVA